MFDQELGERGSGMMSNKSGACSPDADKLRELASWYREFAERAANTVREARLRIAEDLEKEAELLEQVPNP